jgi:hypothetical protein
MRSWQPLFHSTFRFIGGLSLLWRVSFTSVFLILLVESRLDVFLASKRHLSTVRRDQCFEVGAHVFLRAFRVLLSHCLLMCRKKKQRYLTIRQSKGQACMSRKVEQIYHSRCILQKAPRCRCWVMIKMLPLRTFFVCHSVQGFHVAEYNRHLE